MKTSSKPQIALLLGGTGMLIAALFHIAFIIGGAEWIEFAGAPPHIVDSFRQGTMEGPLVTLVIAVVLAGWAAYGFSGAGKIRRLFMLKTGIGIVGTLLTLRGLAFPFMIGGWDWTNPNLIFHGFVSIVVLVLGLCYLYGLRGMMKDAKSDKS
jgi:hypothetical protein